MKKTQLFLLLSFFLIGYTSFAQEEPQTLFKPGQTRVTGFGGPILSFSSVGKDVGLFIGGGGAVVLNDFYIGGYGMGLSNDIRRLINLEGTPEQLVLEFGHGGFWFGYDFKANRLIHLTASTKIGWGGVGYVRPNSVGVGFDPLNPLLAQDDVFVLIPELGVELNVTKFLKVALTANYRYVGGVDLIETTSNDLSGIAGLLSFKFGWFTPKQR